MTEIAVGIDIGGTNTKIGLVNRAGEALASTSLPTNDKVKPESFVETVSDEIRKLVESLEGKLTILGIGIGAPNGNYYHGTIENAVNLKWKGIVPLAGMFKARFNVPVVLTNDANAAAIGEMVYGGAKGMKNFIVITLGTGLGSGIVVNGELVYGHDGFAGEMGHLTVRPYGRLAPTGRKGSLETYVSATGIKRTVFKMLAKYIEDSPLRDVSYNQLTAKMVTEAAQQGDKIALESFEYTGELLGRILSDAAAYLSPEAIFLFGGLAEAGEYLFEPTQRHMEANMLQIFRGKIKLLPSAFNGANAAVLGASALVWKELQD